VIDLFDGALPSYQPKEPEPMEDTRTHVRLARKDRGDDVSFSRYVKVREPGSARVGKKASPKLPGLENSAAREGRTYFGKSVKQPGNMKNLLVSGHSNVKIGRDVRVGKFKGWWLYTLSLEERKTCPRACHHWQNCYGNSMPYAKRIDHRANSFLHLLEENIERLLAVKGRPGIIVRLHALGDFHSVDYVEFWGQMLARHPGRLMVFGYTAYLPTDPDPKSAAIGRAVDQLIDLYPGRAMIRFSNGGFDTRSTVPIVDAVDCPPGAFVCPEQTGQFDACGKCGACWTTLKNVAFMAH
jgi:hypothetical protein